MKQTTLDLIKNINENTFIPANTKNGLFELFQLDTVADLRKVSRNFMKIYELLEHFDDQTSSATNEKKGIVKLGTETGASLEGNRLAEIIGLEFGGNIQDTGNKVKGKFYFDNVTKFYYECIEDNSLTYNDSSKFRAISNKPISDRVENLLEKGNNYCKIGNFIIQSGVITFRKSDGANGVVGNFTIPFKVECFSIVGSDVWNGVNRTSISAISLTQFKCWGKDGSDNFNDTTIRWTAFGY